MVRRKKVPCKIRILSSPVLVIGAIFGWLCEVGIIIFWLSYAPARNANIFLTVFLVAMLSAMLIVLPVSGARSLFPIITIDETGISRSFLGVLCKLHISWDEMTEAVFTPHFLYVNGIIWFSKTKKISEIDVFLRYKVKDAIPISLYKKRYAVIKQYLKQPIVGLTDDFIEKSKSDEWQLK